MTKPQTFDAATLAVKEGEDALAALQTKLEACQQRMGRIREEKEERSYDAHLNGGKAHDQLGTLNRELIALQLQSEDLNSAVKRAKRNLAAARQTLAAAEQRQKAEQVLVLVDGYEQAGLEAHRALQAAFTHLQKAQNIGIEIKKLGASVPEWFTFAGNLDRALATEKLKIMSAQLVRDLPPPHLRKTLAEVFSTIAAGVRARARAAIGQKVEAA